MYPSKKVTFVENLPSMDELENASHKRVIENYEHMSPIPPPISKKNGPYTLYENIYGGESKSISGQINEESSHKDFLLNKAMQKLPSRLEGGNLSMPMPMSPNFPSQSSQQQQPPQFPLQPPPPPLHPPRSYNEPKFIVPEYHQNQSYIIYENTKIPTYSSTYQQHNDSLPPPRLRQRQTQSLCSMIHEHIASCSLCNNLYITTIESKCKLPSSPSRNMNTLSISLILIILFIIIFIAIKKIWQSKTNQ